MSKRPAGALPAIEKLKLNRGLQPLLARLKRHRDLLAAVRRFLPEAMRPHCLACVLDDRGLLTLYVDTAAWASRLRFQQMALLPALGEIAAVRRIQARVLLPVARVERAAPPPRVPDPAILAQLEHNARFVDDPKIRRALERLVEAMKRSPPPGGKP